MSQVGDNIRKYRKLRGLTQKDLASKSGVNKTTITKYESGKYSKPSMTTLYKIADALEIRVDQLISDSIDLIENYLGGQILTPEEAESLGEPDYVESFTLEELMNMAFDGEDKSTKDQILSIVNLLNEEGQEKLLEYARMLYDLGKYKI